MKIKKIKEGNFLTNFGVLDSIAQLFINGSNKHKSNSQLNDD